MPLSLINQFKEYIKIMDNHDFFQNNIINIDNCPFLSPTIILPLVSLVVKYDKKIKEPNDFIINEYLLSALGIIKHNNTTLPFRRIEKSNDNSTQLTKDILSIMNPPKDNTNALKFIFYEIIANVYDHSNLMMVLL